MIDSNVEAAQGVVFIVGLYEGVISLAATIFGFEPFLSLPRRLDEPWSIVLAIAVIVVSAVILERLERAKR